MALTRAFLDRIAAIDPQLNAYLLVTADQALDQARVAEAEIMSGNCRDPMHGIATIADNAFQCAGRSGTGTVHRLHRRRFAIVNADHRAAVR